MADNDRVDVGLSKLLRLDLVLLRSAQQVVQERHIELEHFDEFDHAAVGDVEFAVEVERPRIALAAELGNFAIVDVAGEFGRILVLFVFWLEGADADAVRLRKSQPLDDDLLDCLGPVTAGPLEPLAKREAAQRAQFARDLDPVTLAGIWVAFAVEEAAK